MSDESTEPDVGALTEADAEPCQACRDGVPAYIAPCTCPPALRGDDA